jgi:hypothetical protein
VSRRERDEICFSKTQLPLIQGTLAGCLHGQLMPILVQKSRRKGSCDTVLLACPCVGLPRGFR